MTTQSNDGAPALDGSGRPYDQIALVGISATGFHGVFDHERREGQIFRADVVVHLDTRRAAASDDLTRTVDYGALATQIAGVLAGEPANLIETVAERIAATALAHPSVAAVDVRVHKPQAPITVPFEDVVVSIRRDHNKLPAAEPWVAPATGDGAAARAFEAVAAAVSASVPAGSGPPSGPSPSASAGSAPSAPTPAAAAHAVRPAGPTRSDGAAEQRERDRLEQAPPEPVRVVLGLGSNLGASQDTLRDAVAGLGDLDGFTILAVSPLARTAPVGGPDQPDFLNAVVIAETTLSASALLRATKAIESAFGRERLEHWGPRTLDIDLIVYGTILAVTDDLELPHPRAHQRAFVLQPWAQIAPDAVLPGLGGGPVAALAATAPDRDGIRWLALDWLTAPPRNPESSPDLLPELVPVPVPVLDSEGEPLREEGADSSAARTADPDPARAGRTGGAHSLPVQSWVPDPPREPVPDDLRS